MPHRHRVWTLRYDELYNATNEKFLGSDRNPRNGAYILMIPFRWEIPLEMRSEFITQSCKPNHVQPPLEILSGSYEKILKFS